MTRKMRLWILEPVERNVSDFDIALGFVVRAQSEAIARDLVQAEGGDETGWEHETPFWNDLARTTCVELVPRGKEGIVLSSYRHG
jgi:hypothetical protein